MAKLPTLRDVAARAQVSVKTASRVINADPHVADATREAVMDAVKTLDYRPDLAARSLRRGHDQIVGIVLDDIGDPFFAQLAASVERVLEHAGYRVYIASSRRDAVRERGIIEEFLQRRCAGLLVAPITEDGLADLRPGIHLVFVDRVGRHPGSPSVVADDFTAASDATMHLVRHGHTRIAVISDQPVLGTTLARLEGYRAALRDAGIAEDDDLMQLDVNSGERAAEATRAVLDLRDPATAILTTNRRIVVDVVATLHRLGRADVAVISYGDFETAGVLAPAVTVVDHSPEILGRRAAELLLNQIADRSGGESVEPGAVIRIPTPLIERGSGELRP